MGKSLILWALASLKWVEGMIIKLLALVYLLYRINMSILLDKRYNNTFNS